MCLPYFMNVFSTIFNIYFNPPPCYRHQQNTYTCRSCSFPYVLYSKNTQKRKETLFLCIYSTQQQEQQQNDGHEYSLRLFLLEYTVVCTVSQLARTIPCLLFIRARWKRISFPSLTMRQSEMGWRKGRLCIIEKGSHENYTSTCVWVWFHLEF